MNIEESVRSFIVDSVGHRGHVASGQHLLETGVLDSFSVLNLAAYLQETFGFELEAADMTMDNFQSIQHVVTFVEGKLADVA